MGYDRKSELLFTIELGNDNRLWPLASDPSVRGSWVFCHGKSELLAALFPCSAMMTYGNVSCLCSTASRGLVSLRKFFGFLLC